MCKWNEQGSFRGVSKVFVRTNVRTNVYVLVNTWGCCCAVVVYVGTHTHIYLLIWGDLWWVVCCSACDEARTHIHKRQIRVSRKLTR